MNNIISKLSDAYSEFLLFCACTKNIIILALLLFAVSQGIFAQRTITGKVINAEDGLGMSGVSVVVKGTLRGTATGSDGNFILTVPNNATIVVSFIGFKTIEMDTENETRFNITLQPDANVLGNVTVTARRTPPPERANVVTAMGIVRDKKTLTTSIQSISGAELVSTGDPNFMTAMNGKIAGVHVVSSGSSTLMAELRGIKSLSRGPQPPLFVIDGVPIENRGANTSLWAQTMHGDISDIIASINIEDIESITVIKPANSTILYGSAGINGVIEIKMKKR